jgi:predicted ATPase with chaperone activity
MQTITRYQIFSLLKPHLRADVGPQSTAHDMRFIEVPHIDYEKLSDDRLGEPSANVRAQVEAACKRQRQRFGETNGSIACNADMGGNEHRCPVKFGSIANSMKPAMP